MCGCALQKGLRPHNYCLPILKRERHREAVAAAATSGSRKFFLGTDRCVQHQCENVCRLPNLQVSCSSNMHQLCCLLLDASRQTALEANNKWQDLAGRNFTQVLRLGSS